jgi:formate/nitrite transporter FocA (FNT family)
MFSSATLVGVVCFGVGLLIVAGGVLLAAQWLFTGDIVPLIVGLLLVIVGVTTNIAGLVLLYRGATRPGQGTENGNGNP